MQTQLQIRQNAMEVQEYMHELFSWEKDLKKKDGTVQAKRNSGSAVAPAAGSRPHSSTGTAASNSAVVQQSGGTPSVRGRASSHISAAPVEMQRPALDPKSNTFQHNRSSSITLQQQASQIRPPGSNTVAPGPAQKRSKPKKASATSINAAAHTHHNYSKWDKFDVDAALETSSEEEEEDAESEEATTPQLTSSSAAPAPLPNTNGHSTSTQANIASTRDPPSSQVLSQSNNSSSSPAAPTPTAATATQPTNINPSSAAAVQSLLSLQASALHNQNISEPLLREISTTSTAPTTTASPTPPPRNNNPVTSNATSSPKPIVSPSLTQSPAHLSTTTAAAVAAVAASAVPPPIRNSDPTTADGWRTRGNDLFKAGHYDSAVQCYTHAADLHPTATATAIPLANRAMAHLKLGRHADAEADASAALALDPCHVKALQRRAVARQALNKSWEALLDLEEVVRLEPGSKVAVTERDAALASYCVAEGLQHTPVALRTSLTVQREQDPHTRQKSTTSDAPRKGVTFAKQDAVTEPPALSGFSAGTERVTPTSSNAEAAVAVANPASTMSAAVRDSAVAEPSGSTSIIQDHANQQHQSPSQPNSLTSNPAASSPSASVDIKTHTASVVSLPTSTILPHQQRQQQQLQQSSSNSNFPAAPTSPPKPTPSQPAPRTSVEFEAAWRRLSGDAARQAEYVGLLQPSDLPGLFKSSLTAPVVVSLLHVFLQAGQGQAADAGVDAAAAAGAADRQAAVKRAVSMLEGLSKVPRFGMTVMAVPSREKGPLKDMWEGLAKTVELVAPQLTATLGQLRTAYRLC